LCDIPLGVMSEFGKRVLEWLLFNDRPSRTGAAFVSVSHLGHVQFCGQDLLAQMRRQFDSSRFDSLRLRRFDNNFGGDFIGEMFDIQNQVVVRRIAPLFAVERSDKRFLLAIALFYDRFSLRTIDIAQTHHTSNSIRQWRDNLNMKRSSNSSEEKLRATPKDDDIVSGGNFRNRRTDHFLVDAAVLFDS